MDPRAQGLVKRDGLLWTQPQEASAWVSGPHVLRTDHVTLRTDLGREDSARVARLAQAHVETLFREFGDALDLRLPYEPLTVVLHAGRTSFQSALSRATSGHPGWGAFYDSASGTVHVCVEPAPRGALPLEADLRHEMTHQILDLSTPSRGRLKIFRGHYLWLWEGFAAWTETLGGPRAGQPSAARQRRFDARRSRGEVAALPALFRLEQGFFEGRHYDQCAVLLSFLMKNGVHGSRAAVLETLGGVLRGDAGDQAFDRRLGMSAADLDARWRGTW